MKINKPLAVLGAALFVSLSVNLFMAGLMVGRAYDVKHGHDWAARDQKLREKLPESDRKALKESMEKNRAQFEVLKKDLDAARNHVQEAMEANDKGALKEALDAETAKKEDLLRLMQDSRAAALEKLSPEGRRVLQEMGNRARERFGSWRAPEGDGMFPDPGGPEDLE